MVVFTQIFKSFPYEFKVIVILTFMTLVTFIIPTIGRETLLRAVDSLYNQTIWDWKAIIVFDGIKPTVDISDPRITVTQCAKAGTGETVNGQQKNNGAGQVRNYGIKLADTEWIAFLDDDDSLSPTYLDSFYNEIHNVYAVDAILFRMRHPEYGILPKTSSVDLVRYECGISFATKRKIFTDGLWFESSYEEDYNILCKIKDKGYKMVMSPYVKYYVDGLVANDIDPEKGRRILINPGK